MLINEQNRSLSIGGSDVPKIMGTSKFGNAWDLFKEKALGEKEEVCNAYVEVGNIMEPKIQELFNIENVDEIEYRKENEVGLPYVCHIDGIIDREDKHMAEIKCSSAEMKDVKKQYEWQIRFYMYVAGFDQCTLYNMQRTKHSYVKGVIDDIHKSYGLKPFNALSLAKYDCKDLVLRDVREVLDDYTPTKSEIKKTTIKYDEKKEKLMLEKVELFNNFMEEWQSDPFTNKDNLKVFETRFKEAFKIKQAPITKEENNKLVLTIEDYLVLEKQTKDEITKLEEELALKKSEIVKTFGLSKSKVEVEVDGGSIVTITDTPEVKKVVKDNTKIVKAWMDEKKYEEVPEEFTKVQITKPSTKITIRKSK